MTGSTEVLFYWRPGCGFCARLQQLLDGAGVRYRPINIWEEPGAAEAVRSVTGGDETVPTVVVGEHSMVNPELEDVLTALNASRTA